MAKNAVGAWPDDSPVNQNIDRPSVGEVKKVVGNSICESTSRTPHSRVIIIVQLAATRCCSALKIQPQNIDDKADTL